MDSETREGKFIQTNPERPVAHDRPADPILLRQTLSLVHHPSFDYAQMFSIPNGFPARTKIRRNDIKASRSLRASLPPRLQKIVSDIDD